MTKGVFFEWNCYITGMFIVLKEDEHLPPVKYRYP